MIKQNKGFNRIFTILARGYLFHNADGTLRTDDPYERIDKAREFLCAWCSLPYEAVTNKALKFHTSFPDFITSFRISLMKTEQGGITDIYIHFLITSKRTKRM